MNPVCPLCRPSPILPEELILEILLRVPARSLVQFRRVCKSWKTLISDPQFAKDHLGTADPNMTHQRLVSCINSTRRRRSNIVSFPVQSLFQNPSPSVEGHCFTMNGEHTILGSCNGLLCLFDTYKRYVILWNPSIRLASQRLPIDQDGMSSCYGFGYDHVNDKYKLLIASYDDYRETVTKIYTFGANHWTVIQNFPRRPMGWLAKYVNGTLNWFVKPNNGGDQSVILSFDLGTETFHQVLLPDAEDGHKICNPWLYVLRNCLCVCFLDSKKAHWTIWLMKEYGVRDSWTKLMIIPHVIQDSRIIPRTEHFSELSCISENGVVLF